MDAATTGMNAGAAAFVPANHVQPPLDGVSQSRYRGGRRRADRERAALAAGGHAPAPRIGLCLREPVETIRGDAAATTPPRRRRRRGDDADNLQRRVAATPRR